MNKLRSTFVALWNKTESLLPLVLLVLVSLLLALLLNGGKDVEGAWSLFQSSPPSPPREEPTVPPVPTETPVPPPEPTATLVPPEATAAAPAETPEAPPEGSPSAPADTPAPPAEAPTEAPEAAEPTAATLEEPEGEEEAPPPESSSLIFDWRMFLNTVILTLSYGWVCCGVCALVGTPLVFILLYVGGRRRLRQRLEESEETEQTPGADQAE
jgi:hypothetical protein